MMFINYQDGVFLSGNRAGTTNKVPSIPQALIGQIIRAVDGSKTVPMYNGITFTFLACIVPAIMHAVVDASAVESPLYSGALCTLTTTITACNLTLLTWFDRLLASKLAPRLSRGKHNTSPSIDLATGEAGLSNRELSHDAVFMNRVLLLSSFLFVAHTVAAATLDPRRQVGAALLMAGGLYLIQYSKWLLDQD